MAPFNDLAIVEDNQHGTEHGKSHTLRKIRQKALHALAFLAPEFPRGNYSHPRRALISGVGT